MAKAKAKPAPPKGKPGKKICPACNKEVGARTTTCECGHVFEAKVKRVKTTFREQCQKRLEEIEALLANQGNLNEQRDQLKALLDTMPDA